MQKLVDTQRGGLAFSHNGYFYHKHKTMDYFTSWRCVERQKCGCSAYVRRYTDGRVELQGSHKNHMPNKDKIETKILKVSLYSVTICYFFLI